jgi:O-antigen ligase
MYAVLFMACVYPVSIRGISVNYLFLLLPLIFALLQGRVSYPGRNLSTALIVFCLIFFVASLYQIDFATLAPRRFASFVVFLSMFAYAFIRVDANQIVGFKAAIVLISIYLSFASAYELLQLGATQVLGFEAKDLVGSQRFGFIYLVAFWLAYLDPQIKRLLGPLRFVSLFVLLAGLMLTFSRSSIVALLLGGLIFVAVRHASWFRTLSLRAVLRGVGAIIGLVVLLIALFRMFPLAFEFFNVRLFGFFLDQEAVGEALTDTSSSEGTRIFIALQVLEFVTRNPLTGSGFLGVWVMRDFPAGSAHSQYVDVLFRTGFIGLACYGWILFRMLRFLWREQQALFWGLVGVLFYGLFHETFKESQGAFVLAFLVGMMAQSERELRTRGAPAAVGAGRSQNGLPPAPVRHSDRAPR